jgi:hypothetical protein
MHLVAVEFTRENGVEEVVRALRRLGEDPLLPRRREGNSRAYTVR